MLTSTESQLAANETQRSRQVIPLSSDALDLAKSLIAAAFKPNDTGLTIAVDSSSLHGLVVQLDYIDTADDSWHYTNDGVTVSVPETLANQCAGMQIGTSDDKLVVEPTT